MKIAVTAASGGLGTAILKYLVNEIGTDNVCAVARSPDRVGIPDIEKRSGDYQSVTELTQAFSGTDTVVMISAPVGDWDRIAMHRNVIEAARQADVRKLLYTSVVGNGKEKDTWFWPTQQVNRQAEVDLQESGLEQVVARNSLYLEKDLATSSMPGTLAYTETLSAEEGADTFLSTSWPLPPRSSRLMIAITGRHSTSSAKP